MRQRLHICLHASLTASLRLPLHRRLVFVLVGSSAPPESRDATKGLVGTPWVIKAMHRTLGKGPQARETLGLCCELAWQGDPQAGSPWLI